MSAFQVADKNARATLVEIDGIEKYIYIKLVYQVSLKFI